MIALPALRPLLLRRAGPSPVDPVLARRLRGIGRVPAHLPAHSRQLDPIASITVALLGQVSCPANATKAGPIPIRDMIKPWKPPPTRCRSPGALTAYGPGSVPAVDRDVPDHVRYRPDKWPEFRVMTPRLALVFDAHDPGPDYQLIWPADLFRAEAAALLDRANSLLTDDVELLLEEAFAGETPRTDLATVTWPGMPHLTNPWGGPGGKDSHARAFLAHLALVADTLPRWSVPRPYWIRRHDQSSGSAPVPLASRTLFDDLELDPDRALLLQTDWARLVDEFMDRGYLDKVAGRSCVDDPAPSPYEVLDTETRDRLGVSGLWPLQPGNWDEDLFYSLIEVVHDLVARPRHRGIHTYGGCGSHYSDFALAPGRALYRCRINQLLTRSAIGLRLAAEGEDVGRLVHVAGDDRDELVRRALTPPDPADRNAVRHAVALFRDRAATRETRRSAVYALVRILEDRRDLLKTELLSKDESALFTIANQFDVRHRRADQHPDYDDAYLDWVFWWYLGTVELTDRLIARQA